MAPPIWAVADARPELTPELRAAMPSAMTSVVGVKLNATPGRGDDERRQDAQQVLVAVVDRGEQEMSNDEKHEPDGRDVLGPEPVECLRQDEDADRELPRATSGSMARPAMAGSWSRTCCNRRATSTKQATRAPPPRRFTAIPPLTRASAEDPRGSARVRGSLLGEAECDEWQRTATTAAPMTSTETSPLCGAESTPNTMATAAPVRSDAPPASNESPCRTLSRREDRPSPPAR